MITKLTNDELSQCTIAALERYQRKLTGEWKGYHYHDSLSWCERVAEEAEGLAAEWVVSKYFGLEFDALESNNKYKKEADVGNGLEVKHTKWADGSLIVQEYDRRSDIAVLVVGKSPTYVIKGWIPVAMAQKDRYRHSTQPNWWVSQNNLQPIETLQVSEYANAIR